LNNQTEEACDQMKKLSGSDLLKHIYKTKFQGVSGKEISFDSNGDPPGRYFTARFPYLSIKSNYLN
jgi:hypothetical protein